MKTKVYRVAVAAIHDLRKYCMTWRWGFNSWQGRSKLDNWGGGWPIFIYSCSTISISFELDWFVNMNIYEYELPLLSSLLRPCMSADIASINTASTVGHLRLTNEKRSNVERVQLTFWLDVHCFNCLPKAFRMKLVIHVFLVKVCVQNSDHLTT